MSTVTKFKTEHGDFIPLTIVSHTKAYGSLFDGTREIRFRVKCPVIRTGEFDFLDFRLTGKRAELANRFFQEGHVKKGDVIFVSEADLYHEDWGKGRVHFFFEPKLTTPCEVAGKELCF